MLRKSIKKFNLLKTPLKKNFSFKRFYDNVNELDYPAPNKVK